MTIIRRFSSAVSTTAEVLGTAVQLLLIWIGALVVFGTDSDEGDLLLQFVWCIIATVYLGATVITLSVLVRLDQPETHGSRRFLRHPITGLLSTVFTFGASLIGTAIALDLISELGLGHADPVSEIGAVWGMLVSWALFNWGFARIYFSRYYRAADPPLAFPGTAEPRLADFAYFAFTNATTFSVSDVQVLTTRMRWTVVWHTCLSFFFNALIIALALNLVTSGKLLGSLLS